MSWVTFLSCVVFTNMICEGIEWVMHQDGVFLTRNVPFGFSFCSSSKVWRYFIDPQWWRSHRILFWKTSPQSPVLKLLTRTYGMRSDPMSIWYRDHDTRRCPYLMLKQATSSCHGLSTMSSLFWGIYVCFCSVLFWQLQAERGGNVVSRVDYSSIHRQCSASFFLGLVDKALENVRSFFYTRGQVYRGTHTSVSWVSEHCFVQDYHVNSFSL